MKGQFLSSDPTLLEGELFIARLDENGRVLVNIAGGSVTAEINDTISVQGAIDAEGVYNTTPLVLSNGAHEPLQLDVAANLKVSEQFAPAAEDNTNAVIFGSNRALSSSTGAWAKTSSVAAGNAVAGVNIKAVAGRIRRIRVSNTNATTGFYFQVFDSASLPTSTTTLATDRAWVAPREVTLVGTNNTTVIDYGPEGLYCATGITIAASSTCDVFTVLAGKDSHSMIEWL